MLIFTCCLDSLVVSALGFQLGDRWIESGRRTFAEKRQKFMMIWLYSPSESDGGLAGIVNKFKRRILQVKVLKKSVSRNFCDQMHGIAA